MGYRPNQINPRSRTTPPPPPPGRGGRSRPEPRLPNPGRREPLPAHYARKYQPPHWPFASLGAVTGSLLGGALGEFVGSVSPGGTTPILTVPCALLGGACLGIAAWGTRREAVVPPEEPEPEEPLDTCDHVGTADFEAVPVEVQIDEDGDAAPDVVAWLCSQCGAKVSAPTPVRRGATTYYQPTPPVAVEVGDIWHDTDDGGQPYLCDRAGWRLAEVTEVRSHNSDLPTRRIIS